MCPKRTLVALKREAIFGQFLSLIQDEIRGSNRTKADIINDAWKQIKHYHG
jgi:hypothetical protein